MEAMAEGAKGSTSERMVPGSTLGGGLQFSSRIQPAFSTSTLQPPMTSELLPPTSLRLPEPLPSTSDDFPTASRIVQPLPLTSLRLPESSSHFPRLPMTSLRLPDLSSHFLRHPATSEPCSDHSLKSSHYDLFESTIKKN